MRRSVQILACLLLALGCWPMVSWAQAPVLDEANAFVTRWQGKAGTTIHVPLYGTYAYRWEKADGTEVKSDAATVANGGLLELPVGEDGEYVLKAGPEGVKRIEFGIWYGSYYSGGKGSPRRLLRVEKWGSVAWESFAGAFCSCKYMNIASDAGRPDLSGVESMLAAFKECSALNSPIGDWDVSKVANMQELLEGCVAFNQPLEGWNMSGVTNTRRMFYECSAFNQPLAGWDVSKVTNMGAMFYKCSAFNQPLEMWTVSEVTDMQTMFYKCIAFNQPLARWVVSKVENMQSMFSSCIAFNQPLGEWDVSRVENMESMFRGCIAFNQPLEGWDVSRVRFMSSIFTGCSAFDQPLGGWTLASLIRGGNPDLDLGLGGSGLSVSNYSATLAGWVAKRDQLKNGVRVAAEGLKYNATGRVARQQLIAEKGWVFMDAGEILGALTGITVSPTSKTLKVNETLQLTVGYTPADATNRAVTWSSDNESVATVDAEGLVTAKGKGSATITATAADGGYTATCAVTVTAPLVVLTGITVKPTSVRLGIGSTQTLTVGYTPEDATNRAVMWTSDNESVATVDAQGKVTGVKAGSATITATAADGGHTATCAVTVEAAPVALTGITVSPTSAQLKAGETQQLTVNYTPTDATNRAVTWSSDNESVATVDAAGVVTGKGKGSATITVTSADGGHTATCAVTVEATPVALTGIAVSPAGMRLKAGETQQLTVGYTPADATNRAVTWSSSDEEVATVDAEGLVTAKGKGTATITVTSADGGHTASCAVTVEAAPVALTGITVSPVSAQLEIGDTQTLTVGYTPADATNRAVMWTSDNESVATVDAQGKVTGKKAGTATITAKSADGGHSATCTVTVTAPIALTGIAVSPTTARLAIGGTQQLTVGYTPADATNRAVTWSSSDASVATVDAQGKVTGVKAGTATITVTSVDGGHTATCTVRVTAPVALTGIAVTPTSKTLKVNETQQLTVGYTPEDATNKSVTWSSSDAGVATVDAQGKVTGVKAGSATITVTSADGGHTATCSVTVVADEKPSDVESAALAGVSVSPNPFGDHLTVRSAEGVLRYSLVSGSGVVVLEGAHAGGDELGLSTSHLPTGIYWLRLVAEDGERVVQVVRR